MIYKRIIYALLFIASAGAFVFTDDGVALFFTVCFAAYPILSLAMLSFAGKRVRFQYKIQESCIRGGSLQITMKTGLKPRFLAGYASVVTVIENTTFKKTVQKNFIFNDLSFSPRVYEFVSEDSGRICVNFKKIKLFDVFGLFSVSVKCSKFAEAIVSPMLYENAEAHLGAKTRESLSGETSLPQKGNDPTEIYDVRDYMAGDSLNSVHWKLSGKFDVLKSKEHGSTDDHRTLILVDMSRRKDDNMATDEHLNGVLDAAVSVSDALKDERYTHSVGYFNNGVFACAEVSDGETFVSMVYDLMSIKVDEDNSESLFYFLRSSECAPFTKIIFFTTALSENELTLRKDLDITVVAVGNTLGEATVGSSKIINVTCDNLHSVLTSATL